MPICPVTKKLKVTQGLMCAPLRWLNVHTIIATVMPKVRAPVSVEIGRPSSIVTTEPHPEIIKMAVPRNSDNTALKNFGVNTSEKRLGKVGMAVESRLVDRRVGREGRGKGVGVGVGVGEGENMSGFCIVQSTVWVREERGLR
ncbi:hypothetical protein PoB_005153900 [Plakobranchus ocellatus]|uniref:Uncharacterized protein n=1 Tax=Plakobranchus ocellatus TaxID=259542 RepID=A0AAV4C2Y7_9GAST|nr:hypothetical protein PoB_005153900 [Plakobranchus ocellatus]